MIIQLDKKDHRIVLTCIREDGTFTKHNHGTGFPLHDLAHYVVEQTYQLRNNFFGNINKGLSIEQLLILIL